MQQGLVEDLVFEIEFVEQTPIADPLLQAQEACDEGEGSPRMFWHARSDQPLA
jgi:hypothetical protein